MKSKDLGSLDHHSKADEGSVHWLMELHRGALSGSAEVLNMRHGRMHKPMKEFLGALKQ